MLEILKGSGWDRFIQKVIFAASQETSEITEYLMNLNFITAKLFLHSNKKQLLQKKVK